MMWEHDCGFIPVVGASGTVLGLVTDRDICIAAATRRLAPGHISAAQAMSDTVHACFPDDSIGLALTSMKQFKVRRLPVIDSTGVIQGCGLDERHRARRRHGRGLPAKDVMATLAGICEPEA